jgi:hypothetical protein
LGPSFIDKKRSFYHSYLRIERFLPKPKPNIKRLENPDLGKRFTLLEAPLFR